MTDNPSPPMASSFAGRRRSRATVLYHWSESRDTVVYMPFPRSSRPWRCQGRWSVSACGVGCGGRVVAIVSKITERLAVEHGDGENHEGTGWGVHPCGAGAQEELRGLRGGQGRRLQGLRWRVFRFPWPERGWQDDDDEDDLRCRNTDGRRTLRSRPRRLPPRAGDQTPHRGRPSGEQPR